MKTPQEKANELVDKMYFVDDPMGNYPMCFETAKQCALIAVEEIKDELERERVFERLDYWDEVEKEIEKL